MNKFNYNKDQAARDKLLGIPLDARYGGGVERFKGIDLATLKKLVVEGYADPEDAQNIAAPTIGEFLEFMEAHPKFLACGCAVSGKREDYGISIEGLKCPGKATAKDKRDFIQAFRQADDFSIEGGRCYCWYD